MKNIVACKGYYQRFMASLEREEQGKIRRALALLIDSDVLPAHYIKALEDGISEFRITLPNKEARLLFFTEGFTVYLMNCFIKKTQKTPRREIEKAKKIKKEYNETG